MSDKTTVIRARRWRVCGACTMCGNPILARRLSSEAPETKRTCACVPIFAPIYTPPLVWPDDRTWVPTDPWLRDHAPTCEMMTARSGWWSVVPPACTCGYRSSGTITIIDGAATVQ